MASILRRQEEGGYASVSFSDDPDSGAIGECVCRQQPETALHGKLIFLTVVLVQFAPVSRDVPFEKCAGTVATTSSAASAPGVATICPSGKRSPIDLFLQLELLGVAFEGREYSLVVYGLHEFCQTIHLLLMPSLLAPLGTCCSGLVRDLGPRRGYDCLAWPKRIHCGQGRVTLRNAHKTGFSKDKIR